MFPAEKRVADAILAAPDRVVSMPITELARLAKVSEGSVVRFCQSIGCQGYQALKLSLAIDMAQSSEVILGDVGPEDRDDVLRVAEKVFRGDIQALEDTLRVVDRGPLEAAVEALLAARQIELFAVGTSLATALDAYSRFLRIELPVHLELDSHFQIIRASLVRSDGVAIAISHSGSSREPVECLTLARRNGATTIAITGRRPSPLTRQADITLLTVSSETRYREEAMASRIAGLSLLDTLYLSIALRRPDRTVDSLRKTSEALAQHRV